MAGNAEASVVSQKHKKLLEHEGFLYRLDKQTGDKSTWRCVKEKALLCKGRLWKICDGTHEMRVDHNHAPNRGEIEVRKFVKAVKEDAKRSLGSPSQIVSDRLLELPLGAASALPPLLQLKRHVMRARSENNPPCPTELKNLVFPDELKLDHDGEPFLLFDDGPQAGDERVIVFGTSDFLQGLRRSRIWLMDGTFSVAPRLFYQLYTINFMENGACYVALYCLLTAKNRSTYLHLLNVVKGLLGQTPLVEIGMIDFEAAYIRAYSQIFPTVRLKGCHFHFAQAIWRRIQSYPQVRGNYVKDSNYQLQIRHFIALAFVRSDKVREYFVALLRTPFFSENMEELNGLVKYFQRTWVGIPVENGFREPYFDIDMWNCYESQMCAAPRTNNAVEAWHRGFSSIIHQANPTIWKFLDAIKRNHALSQLRREQISAGVQPQKRRKCYKDHDERLASIVKTFETAEPPKYLRAIALNVDFPAQIGLTQSVSTDELDPGASHVGIH